ncbi:helix-turn-helix transcriptional regulator [Streptomyces sp. col6]|uniref:helix-turn-helix transcriptional regulator n=1 Tax=Streptomyces sp. col6 TaxID=2478958 RepID=UPI00174633F7|nr:LuxR family transcriptional regulator [Streptomyces sp. col6]
MTSPTTVHRPLRPYGRSGELAVLDSLLTRLRRGDGGALVLTAPPGTGRTALLDHAVAAHRSPGAGPVLHTAGVPAERWVPYSGLHALLCAAPEGAVPGGPDRVLRDGLAPAALLGLLRRLGAGRPLLVCVDDAHLWDPDSRAALAFAARRLGPGGRAAVLIGAGDETSFAGLPALRLGPLDDDAAAALLDRITGHGGDGGARRGVDPVVRGEAVDPVVRGELIREAAGNPRLLTDLTARLTSGQLAGRTPLPHPLPGADDVLAAHAAGVGHLPAGTRTLLLIAAAAHEHEPEGTGADLALVRGAAASAAPVPAPLAAGVLQRAGDRVHFTHPLLRHALLHRAPPHHRRAVHNLLADRLAAGPDGLAALVQRACAASGPDARLAAALEAAALRPRPHAERAAALVRAAALTPDGAERAARYVAAAEQTRLAGEPGRARGLLARAGVQAGRGAACAGEAVHAGQGRAHAEHVRHPGCAGCDACAGEAVHAGQGRAHAEHVRHPGCAGCDACAGDDVYAGQNPGRPGHDRHPQHAAAHLVRGLLALRDGPVPDAHATLLTAARLLAQHDPGRVRDALLGAAEAAWAAGDALGYLDALTRIPVGRADRVLAQYRDGMCAVLRGRLGEGHTLLRRCLGSAARSQDPGTLLRAGAAGLVLGDLDAACRAGARALDAVRVSGADALLPQALEHLAYAELRAGRHARARAHALDGLRAARRTGQSNTAAPLHAVLALAASVESGARECAAHADAALAGAAPHGLVQAATLAAWAQARADLAAGRPAEAAARLDPLVGPGPRRGHFAIRMLAVPCYVEASVLSGRAVRGGAADPVGEAVAEFAVWASRTTDPQVPAQLARCRALLAPAGEAAGRYGEALAHHERAGGDFEQARTRLLFGSWLRRRRRTREAREPLRDALVGFERCRAAAWAARASGELRAAGEAVDAAGPSGAAAPLAALTPQQQRIARCVAEGATNREVALRLSVSTRTVDHHLRNVFAALGVRSRTELAGLLRTGPEDPYGPPRLQDRDEKEAAHL